MVKYKSTRVQADTGREKEVVNSTSNPNTAPIQDIRDLDTGDTEVKLRCIDWGVASEILRKLHRQKKLDRFLEDLRGGTCAFTMEPPEAINVIAKLIAGYDEAGVRPSKWPSAPSDEQMGDVDEYVGECVAEARMEQDFAKRKRSVQKILNRELVRAGLEPEPNKSKINPVYLQKSKFTLEELGKRLKTTIAKHQAERGEFQQEWLDHKSKRYIKNKDGGISNKQIVIMANLIEDRQQQRSFDQNWSIVRDWLSQQGADSHDLT